MLSIAAARALRPSFRAPAGFPTRTVRKPRAVAALATIETSTSLNNQTSKRVGRLCLVTSKTLAKLTEDFINVYGNYAIKLLRLQNDLIKMT